MTETLRVLYADDNAADVDLTRTHFASQAPDIVLDVVDTGRGCLARLDQGIYDVLLLDNHLPDMEGIDILRQVSEREMPLPVVMVTGVGDVMLFSWVGTGSVMEDCVVAPSAYTVTVAVAAPSPLK